MIELDSPFLDRARESVIGARAEYEGGRFNNAANRAYYACFQAAIHALQMEGFQALRGEWGHDFVQAQFNGQLINRRHVYPVGLRTILADNYRIRAQGDYETQPVTRTVASRALQRAEMFVQAIVQRQRERS